MDPPLSMQGRYQVDTKGVEVVCQCCVLPMTRKEQADHLICTEMEARTRASISEGYANDVTEVTEKYNSALGQQKEGKSQTPDMKVLIAKLVHASEMSMNRTIMTAGCFEVYMTYNRNLGDIVNRRGCEVPKCPITLGSETFYEKTNGYQGLLPFIERVRDVEADIRALERTETRVKARLASTAADDSYQSNVSEDDEDRPAKRHRV